MKNIWKIVCAGALMFPMSGMGQELVNVNGFESPDFMTGTLDGQSSWQVLELGGSKDDVVVTEDENLVYAGNQAVQLKSVGERVLARHKLDLTEEFWVDCMVRTPAKEEIKTNAAILLRGRDAQGESKILVALSFTSSGSITPFVDRDSARYPLGQWVRVTLQVRPADGVWSVYLDQNLAAENLPFQVPGTASRFESLDFDWVGHSDIEGIGVGLDDLVISTEPL